MQKNNIALLALCALFLGGVLVANLWNPISRGEVSNDLSLPTGKNQGAPLFPAPPTTQVGTRVNVDTASQDDKAIPAVEPKRRPVPLPDEQYEVVVELEVLLYNTGQPAPHASVWINITPLYRESIQKIQGTTDAKGRAILKVPPGEANAFAQIQEAGRQLFASASADLAPKSTSKLVLTLHPAASIAGRILDAFTGAPIEGAHVSGTNGALDTYSDAHGRFELGPWQRGGEGGLYVSAEGYADDTSRMIVRLDGSWQVPVRLGTPGTQGTDAPYLEIRLTPERFILGRVVDSKGAPLPGEKVRAEGLLRITKRIGRVNSATTVSNGEGYFELRGLHPEVTHTVWVVPQHSAAQSLLAPAGEPVVDLGTITVAKAASLVGRVVDANHRPLAGINVTARSFSATQDSRGADLDPREGTSPVRDGRSYLVPLEISARTDAKGYFHIEGLPESRLHLEAASFAASPATAKIQIYAGQKTRLPEDLRVKEDLGAVTGFVVGAEDPGSLIVELIGPYVGQIAKLPVGTDGAFKLRGLSGSDSAVLLVRRGREIAWEGVVDASTPPLQIKL